MAIDAISFLDTSLRRLKANTQHVKPLRVVSSVSNFNTYDTNCEVSILPPTVMPQEIFNSMVVPELEEFVIIDDVDKHTWKYCMLEFFNFLDIYFSLYFVNEIWTFTQL
jgi:hypothetical protein